MHVHETLTFKLLSFLQSINDAKLEQLKTKMKRVLFDIIIFANLLSMVNYVINTMIENISK